MKGTFVIIAAVLLLVLSFLLFTNIPVFQKGYVRAKSRLADGVGPVLEAMKLPVRGMNLVIEEYIDLVGVKRKNRELKETIGKMELENQKIPELEKENERLKSLLHLVEQEPGKLIAARIIGEDVMNWFKCILVDKGRSDGIRERMEVITPAGLVGQVIEVNRWHAKVMVVNDTNSSVDVYVSGKNTRGIAEGTGQTTLKLKYVLKNDDIEPGDKLITSGKDAIFKRGFPVGIVINVDKNKAGLFSDVDIMPFNNFKKLDEVLIVSK
ncbi:MAG: rod shape-determining protein MreC [Syntrophorhabdales bacterium]